MNKLLLILLLAQTIYVFAAEGVVDECHFHDQDYICVDNDGNEGYLDPVPSRSGVPVSFTSCHEHGTETFCMDGGDEFQFVVLASIATEVEAHETGAEGHDDHHHGEDEHHHEEGHSSNSTDSDAHDHSVVSECHFHDTEYLCIDAHGNEGIIEPAPSSEDAPASYTSCHEHGTATFCMDGQDEVLFMVEAQAQASSTEEAEMECHFHAGVEHCVPVNGAAPEQSQTCERVDRDYDIPLRVGLIFAMLGTSALGAFLPLFLSAVLKLKPDGTIIVIFKQFGTGIIISTVFVHLLTHAQLMFSNPCLTGLEYEATAAAISMAGLFLAFFIEYVCKRLINHRSNLLEVSKNHLDKESLDKDLPIKEDDSCTSNMILKNILDDKLSVILLETGIVFHSILIGITLVVADGSYFITLFIVIVFHQFFEGLALGSRIAGVPNTSLLMKILMSGIFAFITPIGMAIGTGVLHKFNGNDPSTIIALGTLDSLSAGVLLWVGVIEMWAHDWLWGSLATAPLMKTVISMFSLIAGFILMSVLGKWA